MFNQVLKGFVKFCNFFVIFGVDRPTDQQTDRPRDQGIKAEAEAEK